MTTDTKTLEIPRVLSVKELADLMGVSPVEVIKELMKNGVMAAINQVIDFDTAAIVASDMGFEPLEAHAAETAEVPVEAGTTKHVIEEDATKLEARSPVVTIMGHVDHGKTSLLDAIRQTKVTAGEAGGITQHIGAYQVHLDGHDITFLDTPGHEAFTAMRARGAQVTDVAVLVVAADDGVMPQTKEAIDHAKAAGVPIVVAMNKIDLENANPDRVKKELSDNGVVIEEWGGDTPLVPVSARTKEGIQDLLENIVVVSDVLELKADPDRPAIGIVVEAELSKTRGPLATVLVKTGTLNVGDNVVVGETMGRVKAILNDSGKRIKSAGPSVPAEILGLAAVPKAGEILQVMPDEKNARQLVIERIREREAAAMHQQQRVTLDTLYGEISAGKLKELNIILKTDVQGSIEPIRTSLERLSNEQVKVKIIHTGSGSITESDVMLAVASKAIIIAFNTGTEGGAERLAASEKVDIRRYSVIYNIVEDVDKALKGMLEPTFREVVTAHAEVRQVFKVSRRNSIAGAFVRDGTITRTDTARVLRNGAQVAEGKLASLKRFQEDVREVTTNFECGIQVEGFDSFEVGDVVETFRIERET
ncbi:MAG TPA: translation initiation factor IF-2 [Dehalococcoidia bacterium]|jgi:translation initiation factor IF-2|nr:translation initiation factor IF-2 [Dehalococcoidia bacterium]